MGPAIKYGGDGHSHKLPDSEINDSKNLDLNPSIYGPKPRARQFFYRENLLHKLKDNIGYISLFIGKLNFIEFFYESIMDSENRVIFSQNMILKDEAIAGIYDSKENNETKKENMERNDEQFKKVGRNEKCPCGSGKKFKLCHGNI